MSVLWFSDTLNLLMKWRDLISLVKYVKRTEFLSHHSETNFRTLLKESKTVHTYRIGV